LRYIGERFQTYNLAIGQAKRSPVGETEKKGGRKIITGCRTGKSPISDALERDI